MKITRHRILEISMIVGVPLLIACFNLHVTSLIGFAFLMLWLILIFRERCLIEDTSKEAEIQILELNRLLNQVECELDENKKVLNKIRHISDKVEKETQQNLMHGKLTCHTKPTNP